ncbi:uncharacterized protein LOC127001504 [Eriocheir sinensis]|uniref:uncharacterized protein LOC127001504 n=1 Tax=Eriocheir sinensis TaxID=95602 RepID=UPI0021C7FA6D|nr:uncharacterized protein LOC127001504 [Eriocheir sinensis]
MREAQPILAVVVVVGLLATSALGTQLAGESIKAGRKVSWPRTGLEICQWVVEEDVERNCSACFNAADSWQKTKRCVRDWLPASIASCYETASSTRKAFNRCVTRSYEKSLRFNKKTNLYFDKSSRFLNKIAGYSYLEGGPAALFSGFAQDLLLNTGGIKDALSTSEDCKRKFSGGQRKGARHAPHASELQLRVFKPSLQEVEYEYGKVGHSMPFKGVGPLAQTILKGMCNTHYLEDQQKLQLLVDSAVTSHLPMPAWVFQEVVKKISSVQI